MPQQRVITGDFSTDDGSQQDGRVVHVPPSRQSRIVRKILRSKKLTRLFFGGAAYQLRGFNEIVERLPMGSSHCVVGRICVEIRQPLILGGRPPADVLRGDLCESLPRPSSARLQNVNVRGGSNLVFSGNEAMHHDLLRIRTERIPEENALRAVVDVETGRITFPRDVAKPFDIDEAALFCDGVAHNYAHWLTEVLPRITFFYAENRHSNVPLILDEGLHANILRSLDLVLPSKPLRYMVPYGRTVSVRELHFVNVAGYIPYEPRGQKVFDHSHGVHGSDVIRGMVARIKSRLGVADGSARRKIYIKRNSRVRQLVNAPEVEGLLRSVGFEVIEPETLSFDEQVRLFHSAAMIVGATGAAMANMVFCRPDCRVVILISTHPETPYYYWQSVGQCAGLHVGYILCEPTSAEPQSVHCDFAAPLADLAQALDQHCKVA